MAFALYLPPRRGLTDRYGRRYTFDDLVAEMMSRPFDREGLSCEGTHLLYSLGIILGVDRLEPILSQGRREELRDYVTVNVARVLGSQEADGGWRPGWHRADGLRNGDKPGTGESGPGRVLVTGHLLEWLLVLPADLRPPDDRLRRAARWLRDELGRVLLWRHTFLTCALSQLRRNARIKL